MLAMKGGWKIAAVGECVLTRAIRTCDEPEFTALREIVRDADAACGHLEMCLGNRRELYPSRGKAEKEFLLAEKNIAAELRAFGLDMVSLAGDHSFDFGPEGVLSTRRACRAADLICAGTGVDLDEAREAAYLESDAGRIAMISVSSGNTANEWANRSKGAMMTRSGHNPLRVKTRYQVPKDMAESLKEMANALTVLRAYRPGAVSKDLEEGEFRIMLPSEQSTHGAAGTVSVFASGECYTAGSSCHAGDLQGNIGSIAEAANIADFVMVSHHFSIADGAPGDCPPEFAVEFAHAAIDAGADLYIGHGWNKMLGVEIYKGKPIIYGLGNFFAQAPFVSSVPYDRYESRGCDMAALAALCPSDTMQRSGSTIQELISVVVSLAYAPDKQLREIVFYPVELGLDLEKDKTEVNRFTGAYVEGRPFLVKGMGAKKIISRLQELSEQFGTKIEFRDGVGYWNL